MKSVDQETVLRQYLNYLPTNILADIIWNYRNQKITDFDVVKLFITANLAKWDSYREMANGLVKDMKITNSRLPWKEKLKGSPNEKKNRQHF